MPDLVAEDSLLRIAGYGLGEKMSYILYDSLKVEAFIKIEICIDEECT